MCSGSGLSPSSTLMWDKNFYDPQIYYVDGMFNVYHQDIGGLWHCFTQITLWLCQNSY